MEDLTSKILQLLNEEGINPKDVRTNLQRIVEEIDSRLWVKLNISLPLLYNLKDTVWYNLEHKPNGGKEKGIDDLRLLGKKYPTLMYNNDVYIDFENLKALLPELEDILSKWSNEWTFVQLFTKSTNGWNGGENDPSPVVIYDPNSGETPAKFGHRYSSHQFGIINSKGDYLINEKQEMVLCTMETKLGTYGREPMMRSLLERLIDACNKGLSSKKGILLDIENYDYMN